MWDEEKMKKPSELKWILTVRCLACCCVVIACVCVVAGFAVAIAGGGERCPPGPIDGLVFKKSEGQFAVQSSYYDRDRYDAMYAVDAWPQTCSRTLPNPDVDPTPWWQLDMGVEHVILNISYEERTDCSWERAVDLQFRVGNFDKPDQRGSFDSNGICGEITEGKGKGHVFVFKCPDMLIGRYLSVQKIKTTPTSYALSICTLSVHGYVYK